MIPAITDIIARIQRSKTELGITLYDKASLADIASFEQINRVTLPDDFKALYSFCNGFESAEDLFRIIPLNEIENVIDSYTAVKQFDFHFAEYLIYCDMWTVAVSNQDSNNYSIYNKANNVVTLTTSLAEFLDIFLTRGVFDGLYKWRETIEQST